MAAIANFSGYLNPEDITRAVALIEETLAGETIGRRTAMAMVLAAEEILLRYRDELGDDTPCTLAIVKRFGTLSFRLAVRGPSLDVIDRDTYESETALDFGLGTEFVASVLGDGAGAPIYTYRNGTNVITMQVRIQRQTPFLRDPMVLALLIAVVAGIACRFLPEDITHLLSEDIAARITSLYLSVLSGITGPLVGVSLLSGICAFGSISALKETGRSALLRMMGWNVMLFAATVAMSYPLFAIHGTTGAAAFSPGELADLLLSAIPTNVFKPFVDNNALQIAVLSLFVGICILALGERASAIGDLIVELNAVIFKMMSVVARGLSLLVGLSMFRTIASADLTQLSSLAKLVGVSLAVAAILAVGIVLIFCARHKIKVGKFLSKIAPVLIICLTTGSSTAAMNENYRICEDQLGISEKITAFLIPISQALFAPSLIVPLVVSMFASAEAAGVSFSIGQLIVLFVLVFQLSIASPKVPGGIAATFTILLTQLGLPVELAGLLIAANVFVCNVETTLGMLVRECEFVAFAIKHDAIDRKTLDS